MHKIYSSGQEFLADNIEIIKANPMETAFFELDSAFPAVDRETYAVKVWQGEGYLLALRMQPFPLLVFGDIELCSELAQIFAKQDFVFSTVLGYPNVVNAFLNRYEFLCGGSHEVKHPMDIMFCKRANFCDTDGVRWATAADAPQIAHFVVDFAAEALGENYSYEERLACVLREIGGFAVLEKDGKIVSVARRTREMSAVCALAFVFTLPKYRNQGFSRRTVTFVTNSILSDGKLPYLFVDKTNPVSNHLYTTIGYQYALPQYEIIYNPKQ